MIYTPHSHSTTRNKRHLCNYIWFESHDEWTATPIPNIFTFVSNVKKIIRFDHSTRRVREVSSYIEIDQGCVIETPNIIIHPTFDKINAKLVFLKFEHKEEIEKVKNHPTEPTLKLSKSINTDDLEKVLDEASDKLKMNTNKTSYVLYKGNIIFEPWLSGVSAIFGYKSVSLKN